MSFFWGFVAGAATVVIVEAFIVLTVLTAGVLAKRQAARGRSD